VRDDVVGGALQVRPPSRVGGAELPGEHEREGDLVELRVSPPRSARDGRVLREGAVGALRSEEDEVELAQRGGAVAGGELGGRRLIEVARPDEVVRPRRLVSLDRPRPPRPRHRRRGDVGAGVALVLGRGEHEQRGLVGARDRRGRGGGRLQPREVGAPAGGLAAVGAREAVAQRAAGDAVGAGATRREAERERQRAAAAAAVEPGRGELDDVAGAAGRVGRHAGAAEPLQPRPRLAPAGVAAAAVDQRGARAQRQRGAAVPAQQRAVAGDAAVVVAVVGERRVGEQVEAVRAAVERSDPHLHEHGAAAGVGDVALAQRPAAARVARRLRVGEAGAAADGAGRDVGLALHAPAGGDRELQLAQRRGAEVGVVDLGQLALAQREPDLARARVRGAEAVLVGGRPDRSETGRSSRLRLLLGGVGGCRGGERGGDRRGCDEGTGAHLRSLPARASGKRSEGALIPTRPLCLTPGYL